MTEKQISEIRYVISSLKRIKQINLANRLYSIISKEDACKKDALKNKTTSIKKIEFCKNKSKHMYKNPTFCEDVFRSILDEFGVKYKFQHIVTVDIDNVFILDFYIPSKRICIEIDGKYHNDTVQKKKDIRRDILLSRANIKTVRISNSTVTKRKDAVVSELNRLNIIKL